MSTKSSIILTNDNEHWYSDCSERLDYDLHKDAIVLEFSKKNIRIDSNDDYDLTITIINPDCEIYKLLSDLHKLELGMGARVYTENEINRIKAYAFEKGLNNKNPYI